MKPLIIIPTFNSVDSLFKLIPEAKAHIPNILVVDDGSNDSTSELIETLGVNYLRHPTNRGKGAALKTGFAFALNEGFNLIITLDADGQHNPKYIPAFLKAYNDTGNDFIIGSRIREKADMPPDRRFSNWTTSHLLSLLMRANIEDLQCGYRLHSRNLLESVHLESDHFELETEIVIKAIQLGMVPHFIPIKVEYAIATSSRMNRLTDTLRWCKAVLEYI
jgi:glycosyltransferase involved in cell wall biosynthesis